MKNKIWKEDFEKVWDKDWGTKHGIITFIKNLLEEQRKEVLSEVQSEVEKKRKIKDKEYSCMCEYGNACDNCRALEFNKALEDISTIIESLKVK